MTRRKPGSAAQRAAWRVKRKAAYYAKRDARPRYAHRTHNCTECGRGGHNARTCPACERCGAMPPALIYLTNRGRLCEGCADRVVGYVIAWDRVLA